MRAFTSKSTTALAATGFVFVATSIVIAWTPGFRVSQIVANGAFVAVGALLVVRRRGNAIGPLLSVFGLAFNLFLAADVIAEELFDSGRGEAASWLTASLYPFVPLILWTQIALLLLFPHGRTESTRAHRLLRLSGFYALLTAGVSAFARPRTLLDPTETPYPHPFVDESVADPLGEIAFGMVAPIVFLQIVAAVMLVSRVRGVGPVERRQIGWVGLACLLYFFIASVNVAFDPLGSVDGGFHLLDALGVMLIPLAMGVAIMRYRLYDIDTIISRSVTFGALALFIAGVYIGIVVGVGELLGGGAGFGLSVVASVLVAMAFQPVRRWVEGWANRLVYGERATPYEVLVRFSRRSAELSDEELMDRIPRLIVDGTGASTATLWSKSDSGFRTGSVWPTDAIDRYLNGGETFDDPEADFSLPVKHDGELLGGLSLVKAGGEKVTPAEQDLLADLASGLGLALRNARLTGQLRRRVTELEASRERVLAASDDARRRLENDLDSGPQQQLVALKVKLGPTRMLAERVGAEKTAALLQQLEREAGDAIQAVRDFAGGIYPPLLEAEGLEVAIAQQTRSAAVPIDIASDGIGRYPREVEAAVYFSVLEALQNTAKYAEANSASVTLAATNGSLTFEVRDDGRGFDSTVALAGAGLKGMADRLDTVGGSMTIGSAPGEGTIVSGAVPIKALVVV